MGMTQTLVISESIKFRGMVAHCLNSGSGYALTWATMPPTGEVLAARSYGLVIIDRERPTAEADAAEFAAAGTAAVIRVDGWKPKEHWQQYAEQVAASLSR